MLLFEYLISENEGDTNIADTSGNNFDGVINPVRPDATPAAVSAEEVPNGYQFKAIKYDVDTMPTGHGGNVEPDDQLQFLRAPMNATIRNNINANRAFTVSLWAYHKLQEDPGGNPWNGPQTDAGKNVFCPQHLCIDRSMYTFVRTKNIGISVPVADRGQLAFTGPGDADVIGAGGIGNELGGATSGARHIPINEWVHLAFVLEAPGAAAPNDRGVWRCYIAGELAGEVDSTPALSAAGLELIKPEASVDIRFGNFRGNVPAGNRPAPIAVGANDYGFHGYMTGFRMYDETLSAQDICNQIIADTTDVQLDNATLNFNDVPEDETTARAAVFTVKSFKRITLEVVGGVGGITIDAGAPAGTAFTLPLGDSLNVDPPGNDPAVKARIWIGYTGTTDGDAPTGSLTIRVVETGETFEVNIITNVIMRPRVASVLVLDRSNSMNFDAGNGVQRIDVLRQSAPPFPQLVAPDDAIGVAAFDQDPHTLMAMDIVGAIGPFEAVRNNAIQAITNHAPNPAGNTAIGDGIERADQLLRGATGDYNPADFDTKATIVLTDGKETADQRIADVQDLIEMNNHIYAIGLGTVENIEPTALAAIADGSGGTLMMTGVLDNDEQFKLAKFYLQIFAAVTNRDIVTDPQGELLPNQKKVIPFSLNEADISIDVVVLSPRPDLFDLRLETPGGEIINAANAPALAEVTHSIGKEVVFYRVTLPAVVNGTGFREGPWKAILSINKDRYKKYLSERKDHPVSSSGSAQTTGLAIPYNGSVLSFSGVRMRARLHQTSNEPGAQLELRVNVTQYDIPLRSNRVSVHANLTRPDDAESTLNLTEQEDGIYTASVNANLSGIYNFHVFAKGTTLRGREFTREQLLTGQVWKGGDNPPPTKDVPTSTFEKCCRILTYIGLGIIALLLVMIYLHLRG